MNRKLAASSGEHIQKSDYGFRFFTETIEVSRLSPLSFFEAGATKYKGRRIYWQNADKTFTLVGLGHASILTNENGEGRFTDISNQWDRLRSVLVKEEEDIDPILFGGFSFDPKMKKESEWNKFPSAFFVVPTFQLTVKNGRTAVAINLVTDEEDASSHFELLRQERDQLIHIAQTEEFELHSKPVVTGYLERNKEKYKEAVAEVTDLIKRGEAEKVVIARSVEIGMEDNVSSLLALHHISNEQQESYHFGLEKDEQLFFGATPERLIEIADGRAFSACVAGSIRRGKNAEEDRRLGAELVADPKNRGEHAHVVDMISDVFHSYCSEVKLPSSPKLLKIRDIQHLYTPIEGRPLEGTTIFTFAESLHPTPALGGVPQIKAMEIIRELENLDRGYYAAPIGWTDASGNGEFAVAIRSALLEGDRAFLYAGGGIVADSDVASEYEETWVKFRPVMRALGGKMNG